MDRVLPPVLTSADSFAHPMHERAFLEQALAGLRQFLKPTEAAGIATRSCRFEGEADAQILEQARHLPADLVTMGTHGRDGFRDESRAAAALRHPFTTAC